MIIEEPARSMSVNGEDVELVDWLINILIDWLIIEEPARSMSVDGEDVELVGPIRNMIIQCIYP